MTSLRRWLHRARSYKRVFLSDMGDIGFDAETVMADLRTFCHVNRSTTKISRQTGMIDPIATAQAEGRREVFLRIQTMLNLQPAQIERLQEQFTDGD